MNANPQVSDADRIASQAMADAQLAAFFRREAKGARNGAKLRARAAELESGIIDAARILSHGAQA